MVVVSLGNFFPNLGNIKSLPDKGVWSIILIVLVSSSIKGSKLLTPPRALEISEHKLVKNSIKDTSP